MLSEFFALPEAFLGFEVEGVPFTEEPFEVYILLGQHRPVLEASVERNWFAMNVTPLVNLFAQLSEPVAVDDARS